MTVVTQYHPVLAHLSVRYSKLKGRLSTRYSPVRHFTHRPKPTFSYDLHVLGTPPAFVLSQDQTLKFLILFKEISLPVVTCIKDPQINYPSIQFPKSQSETSRF